MVIKLNAGYVMYAEMYTIKIWIRIPPVTHRLSYITNVVS